MMSSTTHTFAHMDLEIHFHRTSRSREGTTKITILNYLRRKEELLKVDVFKRNLKMMVYTQTRSCSTWSSNKAETMYSLCFKFVKIINLVFHCVEI